MTPWVISSDTDAEIRFLSAVFGAVEAPGSRMLDEAGDIGHVEVDLDGSVIMLFDSKKDWDPTPSHVRIYVRDVMATVQTALEHGASVVTEPTVLAFGERVARIRDPQGHLWWLHEVVEDVAPDDMMAAFSDPAAIERMTYVQTSLRQEMRRR